MSDDFLDDEVYRADSIQIITLREAIRKRPGMYIGSTDLFGLINYLVAGFDLILGCSPSFVELHETDTGLVLRSDAVLDLELDEQERLSPFEVAGLQLDGAVLAAFSEWLELDAQSGGRRRQARFEKGDRVSYGCESATSEASELELRFSPDRSIFSRTTLSSANFQSYLSRICHLNPGIRFLWRRMDGTEAEYCSNGMRDLFSAASQPYQYLHAPIHIESNQDPLYLDLVLTFHSWHVDHIWSFVNRGRAAEGGTHETGLLRAARRILKGLDLEANPGILAAMALKYPKVVFKGCIKAEVGNQELTELVEQAVLSGFDAWAREHPDELSHLRNAEPFVFAGSW